MIIATEERWVQPKIQGVPGPKRRYILLEDYGVEWTEKGKRYRRIVFANLTVCLLTPEQAGCTRDLASVPPQAGIFGHTTAGPSDGASKIHDEDYLKLGRKDGPGEFAPGEFQILKDGAWVDCKERYSRARSDWRYFRNCMAGGMPRFKAFREWMSLRVGAINTKNRLSWFFS